MPVKPSRKFDPKDPYWRDVATQYVDPSYWAEKNNFFIPDAGKQFTLKGHEYLLGPYTDMAPFQIFLKGGQVWITTMMIIRAIHACAFRLNSGFIYFFPNKSDVNILCKAKVNSLIEANECLRALVKDTNTVDVKKILHNFLYFRGLRTLSQARSISADAMAFDEIDVADPEIVDHAMKRIDNSDQELQEVYALSTPTIPDFGIDGLFQKTDQKYRMIKCNHCNHYTCLEEDFPESVIMTPNGAIRACVKCRKELVLSQQANEYVAKYPGKELYGRPASGWAISQLQNPNINLNKLYEEYFTTRYIQDFWNSRLGRAYIDATNRLEVAHILGLCSNAGLEQSSRGVSCMMGIDVGPVKHHAVIGRKEFGGTIRILWLGETDWGGLDGLMQRFNAYAMIDGLPEPAKASAWVKKYPHRAWACYYSTNPKSGIHWDDTLQKVTVYQTQAMDQSHTMLQESKIILPVVSDLTRTYAKHCHNVARKKVEDEETGDVRYKWIKIAEDHYRKATSFMINLLERAPESKYSGRDYSWIDGVYSGDSENDLASTYS